MLTNSGIKPGRRTLSLSHNLPPDKDLEITAALKEVFQHAFTQAEFQMAGIIDTSEAEDRQGFDVKVYIRRGREFVGAACDHKGRRPVVCQLRAVGVEA